MTDNTEELVGEQSAATLVTCSTCGRLRDVHANSVESLAWACERERGVVRWMCPTCARAHVRDIEGKLPAEYW
ncbi:hypothetical protein GCM10010174_28400 [Kutzneria viridogrisea]|uniref:Uncharacterized protein n=2 Tax=Kutzneria TaxID=43356 RepID=W5W8B3_9PSEU|nr:hypothetical protein [Kutzneria albida]AHH94469.1 hypothetical protein KALB_1096 [Kutzneria albida DSM 43870]MBA8930137.1 Fe2+ or Zn2+ uptake regulation protein [Kutzneria viridogrisea]